MALLQEAIEPTEMESIAISDPAKPQAGVEDMATTSPVSGPTDSIAISDPAKPQMGTEMDMATTDPVPWHGDDPRPDPIPDPNTDPFEGGGTRPGSEGGVSVQELYPEMPELGEMDTPTVADPTGAGVTEADPTVGEVGTPGVAETETDQIIDDAADEVAAGVGGGEQTTLDAEAQVDAELARILGQDSPLLQQARAEAARMANARGLQNTSMAAGMTYDAMVKAALPMAQQNAAQALEREMSNTGFRQEAGLFTAEQMTRLRALEAELGQELSLFNADQLNQAERLSAEMRVALEQGNQQAYNEASLQLAELQRDAEAQQAEIDYAGAEREFLERQAYNEQIIDSITTLNEQFMIGEQQIDIEHVRGTYNQIISTNETAAAIYDSYMGAIGQIFSDPKMSTSQAGEAIRALVDAMEGSLRMISEINGIDFGDLGGAVPGAGGGDEGGGGRGRGGRR